MVPEREEREGEGERLAFMTAPQALSRYKITGYLDAIRIVAHLMSPPEPIEPDRIREERRREV